eukprot:3990573-Prymnesium_polylepis.1
MADPRLGRLMLLQIAAFVCGQVAHHSERISLDAREHSGRWQGCDGRTWSGYFAGFDFERACRTPLELECAYLPMTRLYGKGERHS